MELLSEPCQESGIASTPFSVEELRHPEAFREALQAAGYSQDRLAKTIGISSPGESLDLPMVLRRTAGDSPYETMVRLFLLAQRVDREIAAKALEPASIDELEGAGILSSTAGQVRSEVKLVPYNDLFCISDFGKTERGNDDLPADHVLGVGPASVTVAKLTVPANGGDVFDLGCGAGIQSLIAARKADRVVGTDTNPRALALAKLTARLNNLEDKIEWRQGSFFEPVAGEKFDRIVANPPFVISPRGKFLFCDSELTGDGVSEHVIRHAADHLRDGGFATVLFNWHYDNDEDWERRPFEWVEDSGCDCWLVRSGDAEPLTYAANWLRQSEGKDQERYSRGLDEWLSYYARLGIDRLCSGAMVMRKRSAGPNWRRADSMEVGHATGNCGEHIQRVFAMEDIIHTEGDEGILRREWILHPDANMTQDLRWDGDGWAFRGVRVFLETGLPFSGGGDGGLVRLLGNCRGEMPLSEVLSSMAKELELPLEDLAPGALGVVRKLVRAAILVPKGFSERK